MMATEPTCQSTILEAGTAIIPPSEPDRASSTAIPSEEETSRVFKAFPGYTLAERTKELRGWFWAFGFDIQQHHARRWVCQPCVQRRSLKPVSFDARGTTNIERHLWELHRICDPSGRRPAPKKSDDKPPLNTITKLFKLDANDPREQEFANGHIRRFNRATFQQLLVAWIVSSNHAFREAENQRLRAIFEYLNPSVGITQAHLTHTAVRQETIRQYTQHKEEVIRTLKGSQGQIHIIYDGWRSRNRHAMYGIIAVYRSQLGEPQHIVLGIPELHARHSGENIANQILEIIEEYDIGDKVGYFTLDNAGNMDTSMQTLGKELGFDPKLRRVRCFGHIINLVVKAILFGHNADAFEQEHEQNTQLMQAEFDLWRKRGPVGKLHNWAVAVHQSDTLTYLLRRLQNDSFCTSDDPATQNRKPLDVVIDNTTRWLSQLYMIRRALQLREFYDDFIYEFNKQWIRDNMKRDGKRLKASAKLPAVLEEQNRLTTHDWNVLQAFAEILTDFESALRVIEGDGRQRVRKGHETRAYGNPWDTLLGFEFLMTRLETARSQIQNYPEPEHFKININLGWQKLDEYYHMLDDCPAYYAALALHPAYRWDYFERTWQEKPDWIEKAQSCVRRLWLDEYKLLPITLVNNEPVAKRRRLETSSPFERYQHEQRRTSKSVETKAPERDEYSRWLEDVNPEDTDIQDPRTYWLTKQNQYPRLSRMALDILTVPAMSAECERLFSATGQMVSACRSRLDASIIGLTQSLRSWLKAGIITNLDPLLEGIPDDDEATRVPLTIVPLAP
jgi:hypothetical protein